MSAQTSVRVALRVRPLTVKETLENANECLLHVPHTSQVVIGLPDSSQTQKAFTFDHVFSSETGQEDVYASAVEPLITEFLKGFNATILAYGQVSLALF
jgi:hypothetical protein